MSRFIQSFDNDAAIQAAVDNKSLGKPYIALDDATGKIDWNGKDIDYSKMYLTIEALSGGTFYVRKANIGYSVNGADWETTTGSTALSLNQGDEVRFKGTAGGNSLFSGNTLAFDAYGNIESLEYADDFIGVKTIKADNAFENCFKASSGLRNTGKLVLPATTLRQQSYREMFSNCSSLITAPSILPGAPATSCYRNMFTGCSKLTKAPELSGATLKSYSHNQMFTSCTSLNYIKCLATNISAGNCLNAWVSGVSPTGTFVKKAGVTWPTGASGIPEGWTVIEE